jgi:hypothetical protein
MSMASSSVRVVNKLTRTGLSTTSPDAASDSDSDGENEAGSKTPRSLRTLFPKPVVGYFQQKEIQAKEKEKEKEESEIAQLRQQLEEERARREEAERFAEHERTNALAVTEQLNALQAEVVKLRRQLAAATGINANLTGAPSPNMMMSSYLADSPPRSPTATRSRTPITYAASDAVSSSARSRTRTIDADGADGARRSKTPGFWRQLRSIGSMDHNTMSEKIHGSPSPATQFEDADNSPRVRSQVSYFESLGSKSSGWKSFRKKKRERKSMTIERTATTTTTAATTALMVSESASASSASSSISPTSFSSISFSSSASSSISPSPPPLQTVVEAKLIDHKSDEQQQ